MALREKHRRFVVEYLKDMNSTQAAIRAGYAPKHADVQGPRLLGYAGIREELAKRQKKQLEKAELTAEWVLNEMKAVAGVDARSFFDEQGRLKPLNELTDEQGAQLASLETIIKNAEAGDGRQDTVHKVRFWDKIRALEMLAKHFSLLDHHIHAELTGTLRIVHELSGPSEDDASDGDSEA